MIMLPYHAPCHIAYGDLDPRTNAAVCVEHRHFVRRGDRWEWASKRDGCGKRFANCPTCGNRTIVDGGRCGPCVGAHANQGGGMR